MSTIPVNKILLQELNQLIGIKMLTSDFLKFVVLSPNFQGGKCRFSSTADAHESSSWYLLKNKSPWKNFKWSGNPRTS